MHTIGFPSKPSSRTFQQDTDGYVMHARGSSKVKLEIALK